jgi:hypothetical protein
MFPKSERELADIKTQLYLKVTQGCRMPNYTGYRNLVLLACQVLDQAQLSKATKRHFIGTGTNGTAKGHGLRVPDISMVQGLFKENFKVPGNSLYNP